MVNIIKMDLYRISKSTFAYVLIIVAAAYLLIGAKMTQYTFEKIEENTDAYIQFMEESPEEAEDLGENILYALGMKDFRFVDYVNTVLNTDLLVFIVIFAAIFVNAQNKHGYIKSISQLAPKRGRFAISNGMAVTIFTLIFYILIFLVSMVGFAIFFKDLSFEGFSEYIGVFLLKLLLFIAFGIMVSMFATVMKSTGLSMTVGILCSVSLTSILFSLIDLMLHNLFGVSEKFSIIDYTITQNIYHMNSQVGSDDMIRAGVVGTAFIVFSMVISIAVMNRRDVK